MKSYLLIFLLLSFSYCAKSQTCSGPGRTAESAESVCGTLVFAQQFLPSCSGQDLPNNSCIFESVSTDNSAWYKFHCYQAGTLGFLITPTSPLPEDYDWQLMDVTGHNLNDVYTTDLMISLNMSGTTGITGCTTAGTSNVNCGGNTFQFNRLANLQVGHDYLLMITNWTNSGYGYQLTFSGTAVLTDQVPPSITNVAVVGCDATKLKVTFSEDILCSSATANGAEYTITGGAGVITSITSQCSGGSNSASEMILNLQSALPPGPYNLVISTSPADGNTFLDVCLDEMVSTSIPFVMPVQPALGVTGITFSGCAPKVFDVALTKPVLCSSVAANGSDFSITPGTPTIISATAVCSGSTSWATSVRITLQNQLPYGNYNLIVNQGNDGNTLVDTCGLSLAAGYSFPIAIPQTTTPPVIQSIVFDECHPTKLVLNFDKAISCSSISPAGSEFTVTPGVHPISAMVTDCGANAYGKQVTLTLQNPLAAGAFNVVVNAGTDGNSVSDTCFSFIAPAYSKSFTATVAPLPSIINITYTSCAPKVLRVKLAKPVFCNTITTTGSEFSVTPNVSPVISAAYVCAGGTPGYTDIIDVTFQDQLPYGNYNFVVNNGTDGGTLTDTCSAVMANNYSYPLNIAQSTVAPVIQTVVFDPCKPDKLILNFDKVVSCASISATGAEFSITPGFHPISSVVTNCGANTYTNQVILTLQTQLPAGNFTVNIKDGIDANTIADTCFSFVAAAYSKSFVTTQSPLPIFDSVQYDKCNPTFVKVFYNHAIKCSSISTDGSDFNITGPSAVAISGATTNTTCTQGYTNWVTLQLTQPINTVGSFVLHNKVGNDLTGVTDTCSASQNVNETIAFPVLIKPDASFTTTVKWGCIEDTLVVSHNGNGGTNSWTWSFSDGTTATGQTVSHTFPVATVTATVKLTASNGACSDVASQDITLDNAFLPLFTVNPVDTICSGTGATFVNNSIGKNLQYLWKFGDNTTFAGAAPAPHTYTASNTYTIDLIATNDHGCSDTASENLFVTTIPVLSISGMNIQYCTGDVVSLTANLQGYLNNYMWNNGNGETFADAPAVSFSYPEQKNYTVNLVGNDRFCGQLTATQTARIYATPAVDLGADQTLCPGEKVSIGIRFNNDYKYLWSTGALTSSITTLPASGTYNLRVDNHNCIHDDDIVVTVLDNCLIKVPSAFTPNGDGVNDRLRPVNADLATNFSFRVYNRNGQMIYNSNDPRDGWDGRFKGQGLDGGTYIWQLSYIDPISKKPVYEKGSTILIR